MEKGVIVGPGNESGTESDSAVSAIGVSPEDIEEVGGCWDARHLGFHPVPPTNAMIWIAQSEKDRRNDMLEKRLWVAGDQLRPNRDLASPQYSRTVLGLIFFRSADVGFEKHCGELEKTLGSPRCVAPGDGPTASHTEGVMPLSQNGRFGTLLSLPADTQVGEAVNGAISFSTAVST